MRPADYGGGPNGVIGGRRIYPGNTILCFTGFYVTVAVHFLPRESPEAVARAVRELG